MRSTRVPAPVVTIALTACLVVPACAPKTPARPPEVPPPPSVALDPPAEEPAWPDEPFRAHRPEARPPSPPPTAEIVQLRTQQGLEVHLIEQPTLPTVSMTLRFDAGSDRDPAERAGLAAVCMDLWSEGTLKQDKVAFAAAQADLAADIRSGAGDESAWVSVSVLVPQLPAALDLVAEMLTEPGLRPPDLARIVARRKAAIRQAKGSPDSLAARLRDRVSYGPDDPRGRLVTEETLDKITVRDCKRWIASLGPSGAELWVVGKISAPELQAIVEDRWHDWRGSAPARPAQSTPPAQRPGFFFVQADGAVQSSLYVTAHGPERTADDYTATHLMAMILGGSFSSRINMNLREDKGYAYGGRGGFDYDRRGSLLSLRSSVEVSATALALRELAHELTRMRDTQPTSEELDRERNGALLKIPAAFSTPSEALRTYRTLAFFGLPFDWYADYQVELTRVDADAIQRAATEHLPAAGYTVLVVGDGRATARDSDQTVLQALEALAEEGFLGAGPLAPVDSDGHAR